MLLKDGEFTTLQMTDNELIVVRNITYKRCIKDNVAYYGDQVSTDYQI